MKGSCLKVIDKYFSFSYVLKNANVRKNSPLWYHESSEVWTTLTIWATIIIVQNNHCEIWATNLSLVTIKGNQGHYYSALSVFSEKMGHPKPIKIIIIEKCLKLTRIYGKALFSHCRHRSIKERTYQK